MKKISMIFVLLILSFAGIIIAQQTPSKEYLENYQQVMKRTEWWREARFGMFIHFGAYAVAAKGEWYKSNDRLTTENYQKYIDAFSPTDFDAKKWAKAAKTAGMKYAVLTAKHHDGFCMFDSKLTDYKLSPNFGGRDLVREFLDAFRAEGLKVGLYYSLIDWHHPDYPNVGNHPQRDDKEYSKRQFNWENYLKYMHGQVEELTKNYGKLDILWFDYSFEDYRGEKWKAKELVEMVRKNQPGVIIDNRLGEFENTSSKGRLVGRYGDFETPEQGIPDSALVDIYGNQIPWETCLTLNNNWGYSEFDKAWKSPELLIQCLVNCVSKNGNMLLNVGPDARGNIPPESIAILSEIGNWMECNKESIYGCGAAKLAKPDWGRFTQKGNALYAHWMYPNLLPLYIKRIGNKTKGAFLVSSGAELPFSFSWWNNNEPDNLFIEVTKTSAEKPIKYDTVIKIELK